MTRIFILPIMQKRKKTVITGFTKQLVLQYKPVKKSFLQISQYKHGELEASKHPRVLWSEISHSKCEYYNVMRTNTASTIKSDVSGQRSPTLFKSLNYATLSKKTMKQ